MKQGQARAASRYTVAMATALATLMALPAAPIALSGTPVHRLERLERALGSGAPRIFIKRDDLLPFGAGGNKVRKAQLLAAEAARVGADTLITCGSVQSNHARVTAAAGAVLGFRVILILSGEPPAEELGNLRLDRLFGAEVRFVARPDQRALAMEVVAEEVRASGRSPFVIPLGGSTPLGACGMARGVVEISAAQIKPDEILHASSSGGTQAGLIAGCSLVGLPTRVVGVSVDLPADELSTTVTTVLEGVADRLGARVDSLTRGRPIDVDTRQIGEGYAIPTGASTEAQTLVARTEGILVDPTYTAKSLSGLIHRVREGRYTPDQTVLFWHTGGL